MKKKNLKLATMLLLALVMLLQLGLVALPNVNNSDNPASEGYLFAHFLSDEDTRVYYSLSYDGYHFRILNNRNHVFRNPIGFNQSRDPFIFRGEDGHYYMMATDLRGWNSNPRIIITRSIDLVNWETPVQFIYNEDFATTRTATRAWAPQAIWVPERQQYMLYLSIDLNDGGGTVLWRHYTSDLMDKSKYTQPERMLADHEQNGTIDGDIYYDPFGERWIMFYSGQYIAVSDGGIGSNYTILRHEDGTRFTISPYRLEGTHIYKLKDQEKWIIAADGTAFELRRYSVIETEDFKTFRTLDASEYSFGVRPRHGYVLSLSEAETSIIKAAYDTPQETVIVFNDFSNTVSAVSVNNTADKFYGTLVAEVYDNEGNLIETKKTDFTVAGQSRTGVMSMRLDSNLPEQTVNARIVADTNGNRPVSIQKEDANRVSGGS